MFQHFTDVLILMQKTGTTAAKETVGLDLGNSTIKAIYGIKEIQLRNTLLFQNIDASINKRPTPDCLVDLLYLMDIRMDESSPLGKYYNYTIRKGVNKNILLKTSVNSVAEEYYPELALALTIKALFLTNPHLKFLTLEMKPIRLICTVFEGQLNPFRLSLKHCFNLAGISTFNLVNTNNVIASHYLKTCKRKRDDTQIIGIIDFGDQGLTFSLQKLYFMEMGMIECLDYSVSKLGGLSLTRILVDHVAKQLLQNKGMDITHNPALLHKLKILCEQAKNILSVSETAYIRLDGLPDILVYGCDLNIQQFDKLIEKNLKKNIEMIKDAISRQSVKIDKLFISGGSCKIISFRNMLSREIPQLKAIIVDSDWLKQGLLDIKSGSLHVLDICPFNLRMEGDQKYSSIIINKGESVPLRKKILMKFPSGQLTFSMKFYQNDELVATCFLPQRPRQTKFNLYVEVDHNKMLNIYATTSQGLIRMTPNMMEIQREEQYRYKDLLEKVNYHIEND